MAKNMSADFPDIKNYEIIRRNLTEINTILKFIDRYKNNIPSTQVKKISFFK